VPAKKMSVSKSVAKAAVSRKVIVSAGQLFLVSQSDKKYTLGQVIALWSETKGMMTVPLFAPELSSAVANPEHFVEIAEKCSKTEEFASIVSTGDGVIRAGPWQTVGTCPVLVSERCFPEHPFHSGTIVESTMLSVPLIEGFIESYRGLADGESLIPGRPGYLKSLTYKKALLQ
jgi:hypothetical protein